MHHFLRLRLRSASTAQSFTGTKVLVEYYGRDAGTGAQKSVGSKFIDLPVLDTARSVFVDFPPVSLKSSSSKTTGYRSSSSKSGSAFCGVVVSVFDADNALIYQGISAPSLDGVAPTELPRQYLTNSSVKAAP
jgi:hypothetical protein